MLSGCLPEGIGYSSSFGPYHACRQLASNHLHGTSGGRLRLWTGGRKGRPCNVLDTSINCKRVKRPRIRTNKTFSLHSSLNYHVRAIINVQHTTSEIRYLLCSSSRCLLLCCCRMPRQVLWLPTYLVSCAPRRPPFRQAPVRLSFALHVSLSSHTFQPHTSP